MTSDQLLPAIALLAWLAFVVSGLVRRRLPAREIARPTTIWAVIIAATWVAISLMLRFR